MINFCYRPSRGLLLMQLDPQTRDKASALQGVFRLVNKEQSELGCLLCEGSDQ